MASSHRQARAGRLAGILLRTQPDERLVAMSQDGSVAAFDEIARRHRPALIAFATSVAPPAQAEDVVQDSLLKAYSALREGAQPELLRAWLFRIVRNAAIDEQRGVRHHEQLDENHDGVEQPPQALDRREQIASLMMAIQDLPAAQRQAIVQRELEGRGHEEIGRALDLSTGAVRQLIYRARHSLREAAGALIPAAVVRAASLPGADTAAGGLGMAGAVKVGVAAVVATGTIVAGTSFEKHETGATAVALTPPVHRHGPATGPNAIGDRRESNGAGERSSRDGASSWPSRSVAPARRGSLNGGETGQAPAPSSNRGPGGNSGPGGDSGSGENSGPGSGSGSGSEGSGSGDGGSGSSGDGGSGSSGPGGGDALVSGGGSDDGGSGSSGSDDSLGELDGGHSGPG